MALLNIANQLDDLSELKYKEQGNGDYLKLFFTKDKHIITHGVDFLEDYNTNRGLVPTYNLVDTESKDNNGNNPIVNYGVLGKSGWEKITLNHLPILSNLEKIDDEKDKTILSTAQAIEYISNRIKAANAMRFKGTISSSSDLPMSAQAGDTYRISAAGTYAGQVCVAGDVIICIQDYTVEKEGQQDSSSYWHVIEGNITGYITSLINGKNYQLYSNQAQGFTMYAPTDSGIAAQVLLSSGEGKAPVWTAQSELIVNQLTDSLKKSLLTEVTIDSTGSISVTVGGTTKTAASPGNWTINTTGQAGSVKHTLGAGIGLTMRASEITNENGTQTINNTYNGSSNITIDLVAATTELLGGVIVGDNITVSSGTISITKDNVVEALGYTPDGPSNHSTYSLSTSYNDNDSPAIFLNADRDGDKTSSVQVIGNDKTTVIADDLGLIISSTWRSIAVDSSEIDYNKRVNFLSSDSISFGIGEETSGDETIGTNISLGLRWHNISTDTYEYVN